MCQNTQEEFVLTKLSQDFGRLRKCLKCDSDSTVVTRVHEAMCRPCFMEYFTHKFRATIGKNRLFDAHEKVLFAYSGSASSVAMLHLIKQGVSEEAKKKFLFKPTLLFIDDSSIHDSTTVEQRLESLNKVRQSVETSGFPVIYSLIENNFIDDPESVLYYDDISKIKFNVEYANKVRDLVKSTKTLTSKEELLRRIRTVLIERIAVKIGIRKVLLAIDCTKLTIQLLSNVAQGKAAHLSSEMNLKDNHLESVEMVRPLRELTSKEICYYNHYNSIEPVCYDNLTTMAVANSTIYGLTERFVIGLQNNYPTTISTLFRTSDKFSNPGKDEADVVTDESTQKKPCVLCSYNVDTKLNKDNMNTISDVQFSHQLMQMDGQQVKNSHFTDSLCYSCQLILRDSTNPAFFEDAFNQPSKESLRNHIKDYLLE